MTLDWLFVLMGLALFPLMKTGMRVNRLEGAVLLLGFLAYLTLLARGA